MHNLIITNLCLDDPEAANEGFTSLFIEHEQQSFPLCHFNDKNLQFSTKLKFAEGENLILFTMGPGKISVTGYYEQKIDEDEETANVVEEDEEEIRNSHIIIMD
ncbi:uncharacterized protein LOC131955656 [Physella acuta]|uniref:uncharacterized protein LOC131955656 n=1 Tax=Physella acuta TaxID=109671 RepID=UPI0027DDCDFF|nr:uncharacterized protein LOC131955656 [Physella acuta]